MIFIKFLSSHFFGVPPNFEIYGHTFVYHLLQGNIFKVFGFSVTIFLLFFVKLMQHMWFNAYQMYIQHIHWANLVQNFKISQLHWNLTPRLIQIRRIQWWCSLSLFQTGNTFFEQIWSKKIKIVSLSWNLVLRLVWICQRIQ